MTFDLDSRIKELNASLPHSQRYTSAKGAILEHITTLENQVLLAQQRETSATELLRQEVNRSVGLDAELRRAQHEAFLMSAELQSARDDLHDAKAVQKKALRHAGAVMIQLVSPTPDYAVALDEAQKLADLMEVPR